MERRDAADRNLLFGLLALQNGLIDQSSLVGAFHAWTRDQNRSIAGVLVSQGAIDGDERALIEGLAEKHLKRQGGDLEKSLAVLGASPSTREELSNLYNPKDEASLLDWFQALSDRLRWNREDRQAKASLDLVVGTTEDASDRTATFAVAATTLPGQRFRVIRPHAQGGLGSVSVALDAELNREVALKEILDHHADDPRSRSRFVLEAEITGGLEHPGIVPVYALGTYGNGRPYYAMRFIRGDSLKEAIAEFHSDDRLKRDAGARALALRQLLRRFHDLCNAIEYAHSRGVLHRDIKPRNVMVGKHGETLVVDWGLAKLIGKSSSGKGSDERTLMPSSASGSSETLPGSALGTPAYMSPEQASGEIDKLGPCSDVYSLGATLYHLLTGKPAFQGDDLGAVLHAVEKGDFPAPRKIDPTIDRALEAVCLKAMAVDPEDRHASPKALADDLERWAADEPVSAWREPMARRARRWARRNRTAVTASAVALLVALFGTGAVLAVQTKANAALKKSNGELAIAHARESAANADLTKSNAALVIANNRETKANVALTRANVDLAAAKDREAARFALAKDAISLFHGLVGDDLVLKEDQFKPLRDKLLRGAAEFYGKLEKLLEGQADPASRKSLGQAYFDLGELTSKIGDKPKALEAHRKALAVRRDLSSGEGPAADEARADVARSLFATAGLLSSMAKKADAIADYERAIVLLEGLDLKGRVDGHRALMGRVLRRIGLMYDETGNQPKAKSAYERSLEVLTPLVDAHPEVAEYRSDLAASYQNIASRVASTGDPAGGLTWYRRALELRQKLRDDHPTITEYRSDLARTINSIGGLQLSNGDPTGALESYRRALEIRQKLADDNPAVSSFRADVASSHVNVGNVQSSTGDLPGALESTRQSLAIRQKLADDNPTVLSFQVTLANNRYNLGNLLFASGELTDALGSYQQALAIFQKLAAANQNIPGLRSTMSKCHNNIGNLLYTSGDLIGALASYRLALPIQQKLVDDNPTILSLQAELARIQSNIGLLLAATGDSAGALESTRQALAIQQRLVDANPASTEYRSDLATSLYNMANRLAAHDDLAGALESARRALAIQRKLVDDNPAVTSYRSALASSDHLIGSFLVATGDAEGALALVLEAHAILQKLADDNPTVPEFRFDLARSHAALGNLKLLTGDPAAALASHRRALAIRQKLADDNPAVAIYRAELAASHGRSGSLLFLTGDPAGAFASYRQGLAILEGIADDKRTTIDYLRALASIHHDIGITKASIGDPAGALESHRRALAVREKLVGDNPNASDFRSEVAISHVNISSLLASRGDRAGASAELERARSITQALVDSNPTIPGYRDALAGIDTLTAVALNSLGRSDEAMVLHHRAVAIRERLVEAHPTIAAYPRSLADSLQRRGLAKRAASDASGAVADVHRALGLYEGLPNRSSLEWFEMARCRAILAGLAGQDGSGLSAGDAGAEADKAIELLRRAVALGYRDSASIKWADVFEPIFSRPDFQLMILDLTFPANPFL